MDYNTFLEVVKASVQERLGDEYEVDILKVPKNNNGMVDALAIKRKTEHIAPLIYLAPYYEQLGVNMTLPKIVAHIILTNRENSTPPPFLLSDTIFDIDNIKSKVVFKLIRAEGNHELLEEIPNVRFLDMAIVFYLMIDRDESGEFTALIHNSHLACWNITAEELFKLAKINTPKLLPAEIKTIIESMYEDMPDDMREEDIIDEMFADMVDEPPFYTVTNQNKTNGAACILYEGCLEQFAKEKKTDIIILPSSVHECLLLLDEAHMDYEQLQKMVEDINRTEVPPKEVLSDSIYRYSLSDGKISIVKTR